MKNVARPQTQEAFEGAQSFAQASQSFAQFLRKPLKMVEQQNLK